MTSPDPPSDDELRTAIADAVSDPAVIEMFLAAFQADENDEAVYGWMVEDWTKVDSTLNLRDPTPRDD